MISVGIARQEASERVRVGWAGACTPSRYCATLTMDEQGGGCVIQSIHPLTASLAQCLQLSQATCLARGVGVWAAPTDESPRRAAPRTTFLHPTIRWRRKRGTVRTLRCAARTSTRGFVDQTSSGLLHHLLRLIHRWCFRELRRRHHPPLAHRHDCQILTLPVVERPTERESLARRELLSP